MTEHIDLATKDNNGYCKWEQTPTCEEKPQVKVQGTNPVAKEVDEATQGEPIKRPKYSVIPDDSRRQLVEMILQKGKSMQEAAQECGINVSTAKGIMQVYLKEGRIGKKRTRDRTTNIITNYIMTSNNPLGAQSVLTPLFTTVSSAQTPNMPNMANIPNMQTQTHHAQMAQMQLQHQMTTNTQLPMQFMMPRIQYAAGTPAASIPFQYNSQATITNLGMSLPPQQTIYPQSSGMATFQQGLYGFQNQETHFSNLSNLPNLPRVVNPAINFAEIPNAQQFMANMTSSKAK